MCLALCETSSLACLTYKEPVLSIRLEQFDLSNMAIGAVFSVDTISYTLTSLMLNFQKENKKNYSGLVTIGTFVFALAMLLTGPMPYLPD